MTRLFLLLSVLALAGCGVAGDPVPPPPKPGISITGEVAAGVSFGG